ncbi:MAG: hypothetical protein JRH20_14860 [Deltaproteobacteria bacterium]|nr:hypothetical protein [Deltaproteobacteria bacterium]
MAEAIAEYDARLEQTGFHVVRHSVMLPLAVSLPSIDELTYYFVSTDIGSIAHLTVLMAAWAGRALLIRNQITRDRRNIPLVIGGWGSRGKSGTERLKAGLFHGMGYRVVAKTTGCEAMFIASIPGQEPTEIFLYRPYDKATIWEQRDILSIGVGLDAQVFLWECMALRPSFVEVLQQEWMHDDIATITNTYPDHEDIQGPAGRDVADTIGLFIPRNSITITTEQHMTPALVQRARERNCELVICRAEEWELLPKDVLARFPYHEHPKNIALTARMAAMLGIREDVALKEMADHVVADIGVLKEYGPISYKKRTLSLINGSSANERAGHLSNWDRLALGEWEATSGLHTRMVLVVNNRADRLARQAVFEKIAINDMGADAVFVIGTNVRAYVDNVHKGLYRSLRADLLARFGHERADTRRDLLAYVGNRLRRPALVDEEALNTAVSFVGEEARPELEALVKVSYAVDPEALDGLASQLLEVKIEAGTEVSPMDHARQWIREVSWLHLLHENLEVWRPESVIDGFLLLYGARIHPLLDPALSGDQVFHLVSITEPMGAHTRIMSSQNIKGTGLAFIYRWQAVDKIARWLDELKEASPAEAEALLHRIGSTSNKGVADQALIIERLAELAQSGRLRFLGLGDAADNLMAQTERVLEAKEGALGGGVARRSLFSRLKGRIEAIFDAYDSVRRSREAKAIYRDLVAKRVGFARAAMEAKKLVDRQKGGWLFK